MAPLLLISVLHPATLISGRLRYRAARLIQRKIKVLAKELPANITVNGALSCGGNVKMGCNSMFLDPLYQGLWYRFGATVTTTGGASVTGTPATSNAPFPSFVDIFGISAADMESYATTKYTNPGNNAACSGLHG